MLLISLRMLVPSHPPNPPSLAIELAVDRRAHWEPPPGTTARSKPAIITCIINKLLILLTAASPPDPTIPHSCHQTCHQRLGKRPSYLARRSTTNYLLLSANLRRPSRPCHVTPASRIGAWPGRSEGIAESRTSSDQSIQVSAQSTPKAAPAPKDCAQHGS